MVQDKQRERLISSYLPC